MDIARKTSVSHVIDLEMYALTLTLHIHYTRQTVMFTTRIPDVTGAEDSSPLAPRLVFV